MKPILNNVQFCCSKLHSTRMLQQNSLIKKKSQFSSQHYSNVLPYLKTSLHNQEVPHIKAQNVLFVFSITIFITIFLILKCKDFHEFLRLNIKLGCVPHFSEVRFLQVTFLLLSLYGFSLSKMFLRARKRDSLLE